MKKIMMKKMTMKKWLELWIIGLGLLLASPAFAGDPIIGCPIGVEKGKVWLFSKTVYFQATKAYWNEDHTESPIMVDLSEGWHAKISKTTYRTEFGVTDRFSLGVLLTYWDKDISKQVWKQKPDSSWMKKGISFRSHGFGDIWTIGVFKLIKEHPIFEAISVGLGYKLDAADNSLVVHGIGTGSKDMRFAFLTHDNLTKRIHLCTSLWYEYRGKIRDIKVKNDQGQYVECEKSGRDIGDAIGYNISAEISLDKNGHYQIVPNFAGWSKFVDKDKNGSQVKNSKFYNYSAGASFIYLPYGEKCDHCKFITGGQTPITSVNSFSAPFNLQIGAMWTF